MYDYSDDSIMSVYELMETLNIGKNLAYQLLNQGIIKGFRIGKSWKIPRKLLDDFILESASKHLHHLTEE